MAIGTRKKPAAPCPTCGKLVRCRAVGDDWSNAIYPVTHKDGGAICEGSYKEIKDFASIAHPKR